MFLHVCQMKLGASPSTGVLTVRQEKTLVGTIIKSPGCVQEGVKHVQSQLPSVRKRGCRLPLRSLSWVCDIDWKKKHFSFVLFLTNWSWSTNHATTGFFFFFSPTESPLKGDIILAALKAKYYLWKEYNKLKALLAWELMNLEALLGLSDIQKPKGYLHW